MQGGFDHIIQKQVFETSFPSKNEALNNQHTLTEVFQRILIPIMTGVFDKLVPADKVYVVEKIDLDLGSINWEKFEENLGFRLESKLEEVILNKIHESKSSPFPKDKLR